MDLLNDQGTAFLIDLKQYRKIDQKNRPPDRHNSPSMVGLRTALLFHRWEEYRFSQRRVPYSSRAWS